MRCWLDIVLFEDVFPKTRGGIEKKKVNLLAEEAFPRWAAAASGESSAKDYSYPGF